jgi:hypothetical protein
MTAPTDLLTGLITWPGTPSQIDGCGSHRLVSDPTYDERGVV